MGNLIWGRRLSDTYLLECLDSSIKHKTEQLINRINDVYRLRLFNSTRSILKTGAPVINMFIEEYEREIIFLHEDIEFLNKQIDLIRRRLEDEKT